MARARLVSALVSEARSLADCVNDAHITDAECVVWAAQALAELWSQMTLADPLWHLADDTITVSDSSVREYIVPSDFAAAVDLDFETNGERYRVARFNFRDRTLGSLTQTVSVAGGPLARWRVVRRGADGTDTRLMFDRNPELGTYRLWYTTAPPASVTTATSLDGVAGWEDWITYSMAIRMLEKQESDASGLRADRQQIHARIQAEAANRDAGEAQQIADTYRHEVEHWGPLRR